MNISFLTIRTMKSIAYQSQNMFLLLQNAQWLQISTVILVWGKIEKKMVR